MEANTGHGQLGTFVGESATSTARRAIGVLCVAYILATLAALPFAAQPGPVIPSVTIAFAVGVLLTDLCTGFLLLAQFRAVPSWALLLLAAAYLYSAAMALMHLLTFPGAWIANAPLVGTPQSVGWLFIVWVLGFPILALAAVVAEARARARHLAEDRRNRAVAGMVAAVLAIVAALVFVAITEPDWLPHELQGNAFAAWGQAASLTSATLSMATFLLLWRITRGRNVLFAWLGLALVAFAAFNVLGVAGGARYTVGWDLSRVSGLVSSSLLLVFFLGQFARLHRSLANALVRLRDVNETLERRVAERTAELQDSNLRLRKALDERSLLLREVYHRVKNNLQVVDGIIAIQSVALDTTPPEELLDDLRHRINALGLVHQQLMTSDDLATFEVQPFLEELRASLQAAGGGERRGVAISVEADPLRVDLDFAIPLGLIVTELVQNALKHAFHDGGGTVQVHLKHQADDALLLSVRDDGRGLDRGDGTPETTNPLGLTIVNALVAQLEGEMSMSNVGGAKVEVRMPRPEVRS